MFYYLSWVDARFKDEVATATNASLNDPQYNSGKGCDSPCQSSGKVASGGCCDSVFLPHIEHTNIYALSQASSHLAGAPFEYSQELMHSCSGICMPPAKHNDADTRS